MKLHVLACNDDGQAKGVYNKIMNTATDIDFFTIVAERKQKLALLTAVSRIGGRLLTVIYGRGSAVAGSWIDAIGMAPEENKVIMTGLLPARCREELLQVLVTEFAFDKPNTGIAFVISMDEISY